MSWLFSQALVEEYSVGTSLAGQPCAQLNVMPTPHKFWRNDKTIDASDHSRFGLTLQLLTDGPGTELLMSFLLGSRARIFQSSAKGGGIEGARSGLWKEIPRIVRETGARLVWLENSPALTSRGLSVVLGDLAEMGFDAEWGVLGAHHTDARHERERIWILAYANRSGLAHAGGLSTAQARANVRVAFGLDGGPCALTGRTLRWPPEPSMGRVDYGMAHGMEQLRALGNGQVPRVAAAAWEILAC